MFAAFLGKAEGGPADSLQLRQRPPTSLRTATLLSGDERQMTGGQATRPNHQTESSAASAAISAPMPAKMKAISVSFFSPTNLVESVE